MQDSGWDDDCLGSCDPKLTAQKSEVKDTCSLSEGTLEFVCKVTGAPHLRGAGCLRYSPQEALGELSGTAVGLRGGLIPPKGWACCLPQKQPRHLGSQEAEMQGT